MRPINSTALKFMGGSLGLIFFVAASCTTVEKKEEVKQQPLTSRIYVANESSNTVTVIDAATLKVIASVDALNHSTHDVSVSRDGNWVFATNLASGRLSVIDAQKLETVASVYTGNRAHVVTLTNDNRQAWVANIGENNVSIVD